MPAHTYDYAVVRVVPRVEREEFVNAGVIVHCRTLRFLGARVIVDRARLAALAPGADLDAIERALAVIPRVCAGDADAGPVARLPQPDRFHWLVNPRSTVIQTSPVHTGLCEDPAAALERVFAAMV
jgi:hypothetical protein